MSTVAIIGHGLTPVGKGWGNKIDSCNLVCRLWNWHWQGERDWGARYDWGFYEISPTEMARFHKHNVARPVTGWVGSKLKPYEGNLPFPTEVIDPEHWEQLAVNKFGGSGAGGKRLKLTRGVRLAAWAIERSRKGDEVILVGFDNVVTGTALTPEEGYPEEYRKCPAGFPFRDYVGGGTKYRSHDYAVEGPVLKALAKARLVTLHHAQNIW